MFSCSEPCISSLALVTLEFSGQIFFVLSSGSVVTILFHHSILLIWNRCKAWFSDLKGFRVKEMFNLNETPCNTREIKAVPSPGEWWPPCRPQWARSSPPPWRGCRAVHRSQEDGPSDPPSAYHAGCPPPHPSPSCGTSHQKAPPAGGRDKGEHPIRMKAPLARWQDKGEHTECLNTLSAQITSSPILNQSLATGGKKINHHPLWNRGAAHA